MTEAPVGWATFATPETIDIERQLLQLMEATRAYRAEVWRTLGGRDATPRSPSLDALDEADRTFENAKTALYRASGPMRSPSRGAVANVWNIARRGITQVLRVITARNTAPETLAPNQTWTRPPAAERNAAAAFLDVAQPIIERTAQLVEQSGSEAGALLVVGSILAYAAVKAAGR